VSFLSDTVAISLQFEEREGEQFTDRQKNCLVYLTCVAVIGVLDLFIKDDPPLVLRGCISYGEHMSEGNFIAGPAVDDAAEYMNVAEGAFIWLHPSATVRYKVFADEAPSLLVDEDEESLADFLALIQGSDYQVVSELTQLMEKYGREPVNKLLLALAGMVVEMPTIIDNYKMPLKTGSHLQCPVLNPLASHIFVVEERQAIIETYSKVIAGNQLDLWLKRQHSIEFLEMANQVCDSFSETFNRNLKSLAEKIDSRFT
jgi:hypothetical protein